MVVRATDLSHLDFADADLSAARFEDCTLIDAKLTGVCFDSASFVRCRFVRVRMTNCDLRDAVLEDCSFADDQGYVGGQFAFARLDQTRFSRCDLSFASFDRSGLFGVDMERCNLRGATFSRTDFGRTFGRKLTKWAGKFRSCNLELTDMSDIRMPDCDLSGSIMREALLLGADFEGADMRDCDLVQALTAGTKLARADLRGADLGGLNLAELGSREGMMVSANQQFGLLQAMGLDVCPD
jgi:fluoroquinolone resistance protein